MTQPTEEGVTETTFTRAQFARELAKQVREKVAAALAEYGDLDELKAKAAEADKQKSQLDRIEAQLAEQVKRTEAAEREALVREVADELGVTVRMARKFEGKTKDEMLSDGRDTLSDMGIEPDKSKRKTKEPTTTDGTDDAGDSDGSGDAEDKQQDARSEPQPQRRRQRPAETLRSGAPATQGAPEETDPLKLVANVRI